MGAEGIGFTHYPTMPTPGDKNSMQCLVTCTTMSRIYLIVREYTYTYAQSASLCPTWGDTHHEWARGLAMKKRKVRVVLVVLELGL